MPPAGVDAQATKRADSSEGRVVRESYPERRISTGSVRAARNAGTTAAAMKAIATSAAAETNVSGSRPLT